MSGRVPKSQHVEELAVIPSETETAQARVAACIVAMRQRGVLHVQRLFFPSVRPCPVSPTEILAQRQRAMAGYTAIELLIGISVIVVIAGMCMAH